MLSREVDKLEKENEHLKQENEKLRELLGEEPPKPMKCNACIFFMQHYIQKGSKYFPTDCGHCVHKQIKPRSPEGKSCAYFQLGKQQ